jgi:hypothetical protein
MFRFLDLFALVVALPVFLIAGLPLAGLAIGGAAWLAQRGIQLALVGRVERSDDPRTIVALTAASMIARGWLVALAILLGGLAGGDDVGLSSAVLVIALFTIYFTSRLLIHPFEQGGAAP